MNNVDEFFNCYVDLQEQTFRLIISEWGKSSAVLRRWLNTYHPEILNNKDYSRKADINADLFLPYRKNLLWGGEDGLSRLELAVKAEVIIIFSNDELTETEQLVIYRTECLRLWTRINSLITPFTFDQFKNLLDTTYNYVISNWEETVNYLQDKKEQFISKKDQLLYHYTREDFEPIRYEENRRIAYNKWIIEVWPTLLDKYKEKKLSEYLEPHIQKYTVKNKLMPKEELDRLTSIYKTKLDKIKINKIKYRRFATIIQKLNTGEL